MRKASMIVFFLMLCTQPCWSQDGDKSGKSPSSKPIAKDTKGKKDPKDKVEQKAGVKPLKDWYLHEDLATKAFSAIGSAHCPSPRAIRMARTAATLHARNKLFKLHIARTQTLVKTWIASCPKDEQADMTKIFDSPAFQKHLKSEPLHGSALILTHLEGKQLYVLTQSPAKTFFTFCQLSLKKFLKAQKKSVTKAALEKLKSLCEQREMAWSTKQRVYLARVRQPAKKKKDN